MPLAILKTSLRRSSITLILSLSRLTYSFHNRIICQSTKYRRCLNENILLHEQFKDRIKDTGNNVILKELNPSQLEAVTSPQNKISCVIAGPGAGKTRVLTSRIAYLLKQSNNDQILAVTFTKKASSEMKNRLSAMIQSEEENRVSIGTFHSICAKILRLHGKLLFELPYIQQYTDNPCIDGTFVILDASDQLKVIKNIIKKENLLDESQTNDGINHNHILNHLSKLSIQQSEQILGIASTTNNKSKPNPNEVLAQKIHSSYLNELFKTNTLDFDHLINLTLLLLNQYPALRALLQKQYKHILVDEFQDTSKIQFHFIKLLANDSLMVVGDADQSIYSWRGAHVGAMYDFVTGWDGVKTFYLMENYRSSKNIILAAQKVINANNGSVDRDTSLSKALRKNMVPMKGKGPPPRILSFKNSDEEAEFVVKNIFELISTNKLSPSSTIAVIYRTNAQSRTIEERCVSNRLRYRVRGAAGKFYSRAEIKDVLCFLRLLSNGNDRQALVRAFGTVKGRGIGDSTINEFWGYCDYMKRKGNYSVLDVLRTLSHTTDTILSKRSYNNLSAFANEMRSFLNTIDQSKILLPDLFQKILSHWDIKKQVQTLSKSNQDFDNRWSNVMELAIGLEKYRKDGACMTGDSPLLNTFLDDIALLEEESDDDLSGDTASSIIVNLMTIHAAKGMEFDVVFLIGNEDGVFPTKQSMIKGDGSVELEEERRLCYVAMTRAKEFLYLTWRKEVRMFFSKNESDGGVRTTDMKRSRFLDTLIDAAGKKRMKVTTVDARGKKELINSKSALNKINGGSTITSNRKEKTSRTEMIGERKTSNTSNILEKRKKDSRKEILRQSTLTQEHKKENIKLNSSDILRKRMEKSTKSIHRVKSDIPLAFTIKERSDKINEEIDSTFFYPIGSSVIHKTHGIGTIVKAPKDGIIVEFEKNGLQLTFPLVDNGLKRTFLHKRQ